MPVEQIVKNVCNYKQAYTQFGGLRPFGVAFVFAGWDTNFGFQLYQSDPSGNYSGWKATVIGTTCFNNQPISYFPPILTIRCLSITGQNNQAGKSLLKTDFKENASLNDNLKLAIRILLKTMDSTSPSADRLEVSFLKLLPDAKTITHQSVSDATVRVYRYCVCIYTSSFSPVMFIFDKSCYASYERLTV